LRKSGESGANPESIQSGFAPANRRRARLGGNPAVFALANAVVIALYTFVDGAGARRSLSPVAYTLWLEILTALPFVAIAFVRRPAELRAHLAGRWPLGLVGGVCTLGSYALALWAMTRAPVAPVAALRETSILFGMVIAGLVLKERFGWSRYAFAALIVLGAVALRLA
jgi:drug/metabolite transporter (DMT)-like permease